MGGAIAEGLIKGDYIQNEDICVSDPVRQTRDKFADMGITATPSNQLAAQGADVVCVVVKPWLVEQVLKGIAPALTARRVFEMASASLYATPTPARCLNGYVSPAILGFMTMPSATTSDTL